MDIIDFVWNYGIMFLLVLSVLVFVHEYGHYWAARRSGVKVEVFSIGFGPELFGLTDKSGTRWKFSAIPLGGYVRMFGDADATSRPDTAPRELSAEEKAVSFHHKPVGARAFVVAAGPAANFIFAILVLAGMFMTYGRIHTPAVITTVQEDSAAAVAGLQAGDRIVAVDGKPVDRFQDVMQTVLLNRGETIAMEVERDGVRLPLEVTPRVQERTDRFGNVQKTGYLGVTASGQELRRLGPVDAVTQAVGETWGLVTGTLKALGQMVSGTRGTEELGGVLRIAQMSGQVAQDSAVALVWFMAVLSINLGLINLFPVPMLDGGHLLFYGIEALRGKPLGERAQEYGFRIGLALVLSLFVFATWNDLVHLRVVDFVVDRLS